MNIFSVLMLFGGLSMFLYGMRLMGDGLKESSSGTLKRIMEHVTNNPVKAFLLGLVVTAVPPGCRSSSPPHWPPWPSSSASC